MHHEIRRVDVSRNNRPFECAFVRSNSMKVVGIVNHVSRGRL